MYCPRAAAASIHALPSQLRFRFRAALGQFEGTEWLQLAHTLAVEGDVVALCLADGTVKLWREGFYVTVVALRTEWLAMDTKNILTLPEVSSATYARI